MSSCDVIVAASSVVTHALGRGRWHDPRRWTAVTVMSSGHVYLRAEPFTAAERELLSQVLHESRRSGVRAREPARGREGRAVRPLLAVAEEPPPAVPRRVRRRPRRHRRHEPRRTVGLRRAEELYERVFSEYGDDSVAQLGGVHLACEQASNVSRRSSSGAG